MSGTERLSGWPTFVRELDGTLAVSSQFILHGDTKDLFRMPGLPDAPPRIVPIVELLWEALRLSDYRCVIRYDQVDGISVHPRTPEAQDAAKHVLGLKSLPEVPLSLEKLREHLRSVAQPARPLDPEADGGAPLPPGALPLLPRAAFVLDYASRIPRVPGSLDNAERDFFLFCLKLADTATGVYTRDGARPYTLFNPVIWLVDGERDLPAWFAGSSERIRTIGLPLPELDERREIARLLAARLRVPGPKYLESQLKVLEEFVRTTDGMSTHAMQEITRLAQDRRTGFDGLPEAARIYKLGIPDDPWATPGLRHNLVTAVREPARGLHGKVLGQSTAVDKTLDILMRAASGLSGAQSAVKGGRPRGVLFFAGPTGVGKTELAKSVAAMLFGDTESYLRFDMSEFSAAHAADRLVGAPPGYVGFEAGGELTTAVRNRPFRVVLFDEIEKAHSSILDKFLQILEDGRLTDGQGVTTHFSECVLIFTSNLGIIRTDPVTRVKSHVVRADQHLPYDELRTRILDAIREEFVMSLGRPELFNRFGDNFVIFDFISPQVAGQIFDLQMRNVVSRVHKEQGIHVRLSEDARNTLRASCTRDLDNGGRGIGNALETVFINPFSRELLLAGYPRGTTVTVTAASPDERPPSLTVEDR